MIDSSSRHVWFCWKHWDQLTVQSCLGTLCLSDSGQRNFFRRSSLAGSIRNKLIEVSQTKERWILSEWRDLAWTLSIHHTVQTLRLSAASSSTKAELRHGSRVHVDTHLAWVPTVWPLLYFYPPFVGYWDTLAARCSLRWCSTSTGSILLVSIVSTGSLLTFSKESRFGSTVETFCLPEGGKSRDGGQEEGVQRHKKVQTNSQIHPVRQMV